MQRFRCASSHIRPSWHWTPDPLCWYHGHFIRVVREQGKGFMTQSLSTPCIGICSTVFGDQVCRGCRRYNEEVVNWNRYDIDQKKAIYLRLNTLSEPVLKPKLLILSQETLTATLKNKGIRINEHLSPYLWAYELLRAGANSLGDLSPYGVQIKAPFYSMNLYDVKALIESELLDLAKAHFERYIIPSRVRSC